MTTITWIAAATSIVLWIVLAFIAKIPAGWVHLPLALGATLVATAIVLGDATGGDGDTPRHPDA